MRNILTCVQSSLLGANISAFTHCRVSVCLELRIFWMTGMEKAAVLPDPVRARTKTSFPSSNSGTARSWINVGVSHPNLAIA